MDMTPRLLCVISTSKYERDVVSCNVELPNVVLNCLGDLACYIRNTTHVKIIHLTCHVSCHMERVLRSDWSCWKSGSNWGIHDTIVGKQFDCGVDVIWKIINIHKKMLRT